MDEKPLFCESFTAGSRVYEFEVRKSSTDEKYLVIKEIHKRGEGPRVRGSIMVFEDHLAEFRRAARASLQFLGGGGRRALAPEAKAPSYKVASIRVHHPRAYAKWSAEEEAHLKTLTAQGNSVRELAAQLQRQPGAIRARLTRLGFPMPS